MISYNFNLMNWRTSETCDMCQSRAKIVTGRFITSRSYMNPCSRSLMYYHLLWVWEYPKTYISYSDGYKLTNRPAETHTRDLGESEQITVVPSQLKFAPTCCMSNRHVHCTNAFLEHAGYIYRRTLHSYHQQEGYSSLNVNLSAPPLTAAGLGGAVLVVVIAYPIISS